MISTALLVLSGAFFFMATMSTALSAGAAGHWVVSIVELIIGLLIAGVGSLLLLASHASCRWRDWKRRTGLMLICASVILLPAICVFVTFLFDPAFMLIITQQNPSAAATILAMPLWRPAVAATIPVLVVAAGIGLIRSNPVEPVDRPAS